MNHPRGTGKLEKVTGGTLPDYLAKHIKLLEKKHGGRAVKHRYYETNEGRKYAVILQNGSRQIKSNMVPEINKGDKLKRIVFNPETLHYLAIIEPGSESHSYDSVEKYRDDTRVVISNSNLISPLDYGALTERALIERFKNKEVIVKSL